MGAAGTEGLYTGRKRYSCSYITVTYKFMSYKAVSVGSGPSELPQAVSNFLLLFVVFPIRIWNQLSELWRFFKIPTYCLNHSRTGDYQIFPTSHLVTIPSNKIRVFWYVTPYRLASIHLCFSEKQ
jgi:hypothetical protein